MESGLGSPLLVLSRGHLEETLHGEADRGSRTSGISEAEGTRLGGAHRVECGGISVVSYQDSPGEEAHERVD